METFKIENFERTYPGKRFPQYETIDRKEVLEFRRRFVAQAGFDPNLEGVPLCKSLLNSAQPVEGVCAEDDNFSLASVFESLGLTPKNLVYINWDTWETIDRMSSADLVEFFDDIWYPGPDDIDIFDNTAAWMLTVDHHGYLHLIRFGETV